VQPVTSHFTDCAITLQIKGISGWEFNHKVVDPSKKNTVIFSPGLLFLPDGRFCPPIPYPLSLPEDQGSRQIPVFPTFPSLLAVLVVQSLLGVPQNPVVNSFITRRTCEDTCEYLKCVMNAISVLLVL